MIISVASTHGLFCLKWLVSQELHYSSRIWLLLGAWYLFDKVCRLERRIRSFDGKLHCSYSELFTFTHDSLY